MIISIPYKAEASNRRFFVPPTLQGDFDCFLETDIPNTVMDFTVFHDWYDENEEREVIRGEIYPDDTKSRYINTDNYLNFRSSLTSNVDKGDVLRDENDKLYIVDWSVTPEANNRPSRLLKCNLYLTLTRTSEDEVDDDGYLIAEGSEKIVCDRMPCNINQRDNRPDYLASSDAPGLVPNTLAVITVQFNQQTKNVKLHDRFFWGDTIYSIVDVNRMGLDVEQTRGTLIVQAKKEAGGTIG